MKTGEQQASHCPKVNLPNSTSMIMKQTIYILNLQQSEWQNIL